MTVRSHKCASASGVEHHRSTEQHPSIIRCTHGEVVIIDPTPQVRPHRPAYEKHASAYNVAPVPPATGFGLNKQMIKLTARHAHMRVYANQSMTLPLRPLCVLWVCTRAQVQIKIGPITRRQSPSKAHTRVHTCTHVVIMSAPWSSGINCTMCTRCQPRCGGGRSVGRSVAREVATSLASTSLPTLSDWLSLPLSLALAHPLLVRALGSLSPSLIDVYKFMEYV